MSTTMFLNLPVKDLAVSKEFFTRVGFTFDDEFTDENAACLVIEEGHLYAMLLTESYFQTFTDKQVADTATASEAIAALGVASRERVDELADKALAAGARATGEPADQGFMYGRGFEDPDGHLWEVFTMDLDAMRAQQAD
ncbi:VOC family protein [Streptomyces sp. TRM 70351]|uniref:VOC family protein n=1 Tax=Streptomyces sp. TRM 70351 TaxID=3116552 RepID=UPI002E7AEE5E|nr:VOC family protein [Streptomyces sp. TRM 70351]MEE1928954.1 VOC family protein [Streptomyces sp. TRM 70351]